MGNSKKAGILIVAFSALAVLACLWGPASAQDAAAPTPSYTYRATLYFDWYGTAFAQGGGGLNQLGTRIKFELAKAPSRSWTLLIDVRDRQNLAERSSNQVLLYNARLTFDSPSSPLYLSAGQMNLYDTAGIGQLLGSVVGWKIRSDLLFGGYAGLEQQVYARKFDTSYLKYGAFARFTGPKALSLSLSFNELRYSGRPERTYIYVQSFVPVKQTLYVFGNAEFELGKGVKRADRLSRVFLNARVDLGRMADVTGFYSSGRGLDFHGYVLERSQDPGLPDRGLERFFYSEQYGGRLSVNPVKGIRLHLSRLESRQKDLDIRNHTWRFGASAADILKSGVTAYGDYSANRGTHAESDSYYLSLDRDFGRFSCSASFANTYNGLRFSSTGGDPQIIHLNGYKTLAANVFVPIGRRLSVSAEYSYFIQKDAGEHQFFLRLIFRK
jgi:hypothetical protein